MAIDFEVIDKECPNFRKPYKIVSLPEEFPNFFLSNEFDFPASASELLSSIDPYGDTLLSNKELESIQQLCMSIHAMFMNIQNYSIYDVLKQSKIKQNDLIDFSNSMQILISYAFENDKAVWAVGD